jgi:hypothetical protein
MKLSYPFILITSIWLLTVLQWQQSISLKKTWSYKSQPKFLKEKYLNLETKPSKAAKVYYALMTGDKRYLPHKIRRIFKETGLIHLLTPSGLHLGSILILFHIFSKKLLWILLPLLICFFYSVGDFYSIKRVLLFKLLFMLPFITRQDKNFWCFITVFLCDIFLGNFSRSPYSFTYSFLFWGTIIFAKKNFWEIAFKLFINQMIISLFSNQEISPSSLFANLPLSSIFSLVFPLLTFNFWVPIFDFQTDLSLSIITIFLKIVGFIWGLFPVITPNFLMILLSLVMLYFPNWRSRAMLFLLLLYIPQSTTSLNHQIPSQRVLYSMGIDNKCHRKFFGSYYRIKCKKKASQSGGL